MATDWKDVDQTTGLCQIKQSFNCRITMLYDNESSVWVSDMATVGIEYHGEQIAHCEFDLVKYLDQGARTEKISMAQQGDNDKQIKLVGNSIAHPDAHILFRIFVDSINENGEEPSSANKPQSTASRQLKLAKQGSTESPTPAPFHDVESPDPKIEEPDNVGSGSYAFSMMVHAFSQAKAATVMAAIGETEEQKQESDAQEEHDTQKNQERLEELE